MADVSIDNCRSYMNILQNIHTREDLINLDKKQTEQLCAEIRDFLVEHVARTGGHLASNLGVVELTVAIHKVFDTGVDRLVFDVGHQSYVHKLLTGRGDRFDTLRQYHGLAGFPKPCESVHDAFIAGHASNAVSVALGMARARTLQKQDYSVLALMGDGAITGGLAYEGLNDAGESNEPLIVILNDNGMSITPNVGGVASHLSNIRMRPEYYRLKRAWRDVTKGSTVGRGLYKLSHSAKESLKKSLIGSNLFEDMGFSYIGPVDGHDVEKLTYLLQQAKSMQCPVLLHVLTTKGKGYKPAEENPDLFHGVGCFDPKTGKVPEQTEPCFSDTFGKTLVTLAAKDPRVCAITAAMTSGTGLDEFAKAYPTRFFDVGIAEGHAVSMAGGLAKQGMLPVVAIYSTFLQRAFDMMIHDVAMLRSHVVFAIDRAGLVGADGETHHGVFDVGYLRQIPGMTVLCPSNQAELAVMLEQAVFGLQGPVAVRYPKGTDGRYTEVCTDPVLREGSDVTLCAYGTMINAVLDAADLLAETGISAEVLKLGRIKPIDEDVILRSANKTGCFLLPEEANAYGNVFEALIASVAGSGTRAKFYSLNLGDRFTTHGSMDALYAATHLSAKHIAATAERILHEAKGTT